MVETCVFIVRKPCGDRGNGGEKSGERCGDVGGGRLRDNDGDTTT